MTFGGIRRTSQVRYRLTTECMCLTKARFQGVGPTNATSVMDKLNYILRLTAAANTVLLNFPALPVRAALSRISSDVVLFRLTRNHLTSASTAAAVPDLTRLRQLPNEPSCSHGSLNDMSRSPGLERLAKI